MLTREAIREKALTVQQIATERLKEHRHQKTLFTFDGSMLDQLCFYFIKQVFQAKDFSVICSIRPCMDPRLRSEVREFSRQQEYKLIDYHGDCEVDLAESRFTVAKCENIALAIRDHFRRNEGALISAGMINEWTITNMANFNSEYRAYDLSRSLVILNPGLNSGANWKTIFPFQGFYPIDALAAYFHFVGNNIQDYHLPTCYYSCYNEEVQEMIRSCMEQMKYLTRTA